MCVFFIYVFLDMVESHVWSLKMSPKIVKYGEGSMHELSKSRERYFWSYFLDLIRFEVDPHHFGRLFNSRFDSKYCQAPQNSLISKKDWHFKFLKFDDLEAFCQHWNVENDPCLPLLEFRWVCSFCKYTCGWDSLQATCKFKFGKCCVQQ